MAAHPSTSADIVFDFGAFFALAAGLLAGFALVRVVFGFFGFAMLVECTPTVLDRHSVK